MMGFGVYDNGGSYVSPSSSNLSASAPPFTLDRSPKPGTIPLVDIVEPSYSGHMNSSLNNWLHTRSPTSELNPVLSRNNAYDYGGLQTVESSSTIVSASADPFGYGKTADNVAKSYYASYLSPTMHKDSPFVMHDQASYDWSSSSHVSTALDSSCNDYPRRSLDSKYGAEWGDGLWNGFVEWKQGKQGHGSFSSKEADLGIPSMYENYMNPDAKIPKGSSRGGESSHGIDCLEMEKHGGLLNAEKLDEKDFFGKASSFMHVDHSRSVLGSLSRFAETQLQSPSAVFGTSSVSHQAPYSAPSEQHLKQRPNDDISDPKSFPAVIICPPAYGSGLSAPNSACGNIMDSASDITNFHSQCISANKPVFDSSQLCVHLERNHPTSSGALLAKTEEMRSKEYIRNDPSHEALKEKSEFRIPNLGHDKFNINLNMIETVNSVQESSEGVDHYNHAVDSPCWKGVPVTHSSPFDVSEVVPDLKKLEISKVQAKQAVQLSSDDKISPQKPNENPTFNEAGFLDHGSELPLTTSLTACSAFGEQKSEDATKVGHHSETNVVQQSDDNHHPGSRSVGFSENKKPHIANQNLQERNDASCTKLNTLTATIDVPGLVKTMHNLSEYLLFHCARSSFQLKQKDVEAVQSVINNLTVCVSKNTEKIVSTQEATLSGKDPYDYLGVLQKDFTVDRRLIAAQNANKGKKLYTCAKDDEMGDQDMMDEDKATQAFKKILTENFNEETQPETLLYKNLWLEAEAALCSVNYKARYARMKIEMESSNSLKSKDAHENTITTDKKKPSRPVVSPDSVEVETSSPKDEGFPAAKSEGLSVLTPSSHDDDVMARFQILRCRIENSNYSTPSNVDKPSSSMASPHSNNVAKAVQHEEKASPNPETSRDSSTNKDIIEFDTSVMARFHILKSRADNFTTEVPQPPVETKLPRFASQRTRWPEIGSSGVNPDTETSEGHFPGSEFHMFDPRPQSHSGYRPENVSSDWEHVRKEDLGWQNR